MRRCQRDGCAEQLVGLVSGTEQGAASKGGRRRPCRVPRLRFRLELLERSHRLLAASDAYQGLDQVRHIRNHRGCARSDVRSQVEGDPQASDRFAWVASAELELTERGERMHAQDREFPMLTNREYLRGELPTQNLGSLARQDTRHDRLNVAGQHRLAGFCCQGGRSVTDRTRQRPPSAPQVCLGKHRHRVNPRVRGATLIGQVDDRLGEAYGIVVTLAPDQRLTDEAEKRERRAGEINLGYRRDAAVNREPIELRSSLPSVFTGCRARRGAPFAPRAPQHWRTQAVKPPWPHRGL